MNIKLFVQPTEANMFGISLKPKSVARPLRTIEREVEATRARYNTYKSTGKIVFEENKAVKTSPMKNIINFMKKLISRDK